MRNNQGRAISGETAHGYPPLIHPGRGDFGESRGGFVSARRIATCIVSLALAGLSAGTAYSQDFPAKPIRIVTSPAGGGNDFPARLVARGISGPIGQQVIVDNRRAILAPEIVAKAVPDGYTILVAGSVHWIGPLVEKTSYDPIRDFAPVSLIDRAPAMLVVHPSMPVKSVRHLIALAKARPGELNSSVGIRRSCVTCNRRRGRACS
jgi:tripartite-type tricarboxylate transporter receptor subunit TctC